MANKFDIRTLVIAARATLSPADIESARQAIRAAVLDYCRQLPVAVGARIAGYQPLRTEPGSVELLRELLARGYEVIVPVTLPDRDLDWIRWTPVGQPVEQSDLLGPDAISLAALVLVPAFAIDRQGHRLGRGGGSYDRALARVPAGVPVAALVYDRELVDDVPVDAWDQPVSAAVSPSGWAELTPGGRRNSS